MVIQSSIITWEDILNYIKENQPTTKEKIVEHFNCNNANIARKIKSLKLNKIIKKTEEIIRVNEEG